VRPKPPTHFDITSEGYHDHNRYFNEAEKFFDKLEKAIVSLEERIEPLGLLLEGEELLPQEYIFNVGCSIFDFKKEIGMSHIHPIHLTEDHKDE